MHGQIIRSVWSTITFLTTYWLNLVHDSRLWLISTGNVFFGFPGTLRSHATILAQRRAKKQLGRFHLVDGAALEMRRGGTISRDAADIPRIMETVRELLFHVTPWARTVRIAFRDPNTNSAFGKLHSRGSSTMRCIATETSPPAHPIVAVFMDAPADRSCRSRFLLQQGRR